MDSQLLIFDLDGTLIDSRADLTAGINHMRAQYGLDSLPLETVSGFIGDGVRKLVERSVAGTDIDLDEALKLNKEYYFANLTEHTTLYDGVVEGLKTLKQAGHTLAVLTNKPGEPAREILKHFGLDTLFSSIVGGGDVVALKPNPAGIESCLNTAQMGADRTWMIGDHHTDLEVAQNAGVRSVFAAYGFGKAGEFEPTATCTSFSQLVEHFTA